MFRFFAQKEQIEDGCVCITGEDVNHIRNVLRLKAGEAAEVVFADRGEVYLCKLRSSARDRVIFEVKERVEDDAELPVKITLFQGLPKGDKMEWIIQKAVELGVFSIVPVSTKYTVVKVDPKKVQHKTERWNAIALAAAKQAKRTIIPAVSSPVSFPEALQMMKELDVALIAYELDEGGMDRTRECLSRIRPGDSVGILIGPEGGFDVKEAEDAGKEGILQITLGKRILRTETAGMSVLSWLGYLLEK
ncbi:MAG: 16S rRNA (uracil(1498)-N(3))-methyltransferase [Lachnospiraceae bacterium]|nr:16S rRNA (uracil(1498)-N(3))-methyltransferase [Lachnospiraceae bacterium]